MSWEHETNELYPQDYQVFETKGCARDECGGFDRNWGWSLISSSRTSVGWVDDDEKIDYVDVGY